MLNSSAGIFFIIGSIFAIIGVIFLLISYLLKFMFFMRFIFGLLGAIFLILGAAFLYYVIRKNEKEIDLKKYGTIGEGTITAIVIDGSLSINGSHPWKVLVSYEDMYGENHEIYAKEVWNIDGLALGDTLDVYYDEKNPQNAFADLSSVVFKDEMQDFLRDKEDAEKRVSR